MTAQRVERVLQPFCVMGRKKWQYYYQESSLQRQEAFFQKFLKNAPSAIDTWPRVQIEVRDRANVGTVRGEQDWPLRRTKHCLKYLDMDSGKLTDDVPIQSTVAGYDSQTSHNITFIYVFKGETELTGSLRLRLRLWASTDRGSDMDIIVQLDKLDKTGVVVPFIAMSMIDKGPLALGWIRASYRELDPDKSTVDRPWLRHERELPVHVNEVVPVDIEIWLSSTHFAEGEALKVTLAGSDIFTYDLAQCQLHEEWGNQGWHCFYSGGVYESFFVMLIV